MFRSIVRNLVAIAAGIGVGFAMKGGNHDLGAVLALILVATGLDQIDQTLDRGFDDLAAGQDRALQYVEHGIPLDLDDEQTWSE